MKNGIKKIGSSKKIKNMPGYYLGMAKDGDKAWRVANRPEDIKKILSKKEFFDSKVEVGSIIGIDSNNNGVFLGNYKGEALLLNPKNESLGLESFKKNKVVIMNGYADNNYLKKISEKIRKGKIPGTDVHIGELILNPHRAQATLSNGKHEKNKYIRSSKNGDVLSIGESSNKHEVVISGNRSIVLKDETSGQKLRTLSIKNEKISEVFLHSNNNKEANLKKSKKYFSNKKYRLIKNGDSAVAVIKEDELKNDNFKNATNRFDGFERVSKDQLIPGDEAFGYSNITQKIERVSIHTDISGVSKFIRNEQGRKVDSGSYIFLKKSDKDKKQKRDHSLIKGDIVAIKNKDGSYLMAKVGFYEADISSGGASNKIETNLFDVNSEKLLGKIEDFDYEIPLNRTEALSPENIISTLPDSQTHIVIHKKGYFDNKDRYIQPENKPYRIVQKEHRFNEKTKKFDYGMRLEDVESGEFKTIYVIDDKVESDLIDSNSKISSIKKKHFDRDHGVSHNYELDEDGNEYEQEYPEETPASLLASMDPEDFYSRMAIPGLHNKQVINFDPEEGGFDYKNDLTINGVYAGSIARSVEKNWYSDLEYVYNNDLFVLPDSLQGKGIADAFYKAQEKLVRDLGISQIKMHCSLDVGGYAWAKKGFEFADESEAYRMHDRSETIIKGLKREDWERIEPGITDEDIETHKERILESFSSLYSALDLAEYRYLYEDKEGERREVTIKRQQYGSDVDENLYHLGKAFMLGSSWHGVRTL